MSLRPRYSLLTLIILTTLIAGGVKWWYGPHRAVMSDPPMIEERRLLDLLPYSVALQENFRPVVYEYEYVHAGSDRKYLGVKGFSIRKRPLLLGRKGNTSREAFLVHHLDNGTDDPESAKKEQIVCWLYQMNDGGEPFASGRPQEFPYRVTTIYLAKQLYFLTNRRQVFQLTGPMWAALDLRQVEVSEIDDADFRARVTAELAMIPAAQ